MEQNQSSIMEEQLIKALQLNKIQISNMTHTFTAIAILNANCLNLTTLLDNNLSMHQETLEELKKLKKDIPYGRIPLPKKQL